jgi:hypothetical protein
MAAAEGRPIHHRDTEKRRFTTETQRTQRKKAIHDRDTEDIENVSL